MDLPHFERANRRAFLRRGLAATGLLATGSWLAACSKSDASTFNGTGTGTGTGGPTAGTGTGAAVATSTTGPPNGGSTSVGSASANASSGTVASALALSFTYTAADASGRVRNPFIAVWLEDDASTMVALVNVWYLSRESKYLRELTEFSAVADSATSSQLDAVSGATRSAGEYSATWDGRGLDGSTPPAGAYTLWIEAAREHGPHSVMSGKVVLGTPGSSTIAGSGELSDAVVTVG